MDLMAASGWGEMVVGAVLWWGNAMAEEARTLPKFTKTAILGSIAPTNSMGRQRGKRRTHLGSRLKPRWQEWVRWINLAANVDSVAVGG